MRFNAVWTIFQPLCGGELYEMYECLEFTSEYTLFRKVEKRFFFFTCEWVYDPLYGARVNVPSYKHG